MLPRLYVPTLAAGERLVRLPDDEAGHVRRVLRARPGAAVRLFDGRGREVEARLAQVERDRVVVEVGEAVAPVPEWRVRVTLLQALLKGDKLDDVIRDAVMLGAAAIQPMVTARTEVQGRASPGAGRVERWHRVAVASSKQCGRAVVPVVFAPRPLRDALASAEPDAAKLVLVEPSAAAGEPGSGLAAVAPRSAIVLVGPEGGWAVDELALAREAGCVPVSLGPRTLRADAAAVVALSVLQHLWG